MTIHQPLDFGDIQPVEVPVNVGEKHYVLKEASGAAAVSYRNAMLRCTTLGADGRATKVDGMAETEPYLVSLCLFTTDNPSRPVHINVIKSWPSRVQRRLFEKAKEISDLDEGPTERELLVEALQLSGAPCDVESLRDHVKLAAQASEKFEPLHKWLKPTAEELAKNELRSTVDGSS